MVRWSGLMVRNLKWEQSYLGSNPHFTMKFIAKHEARQHDLSVSQALKGCCDKREKNLVYCPDTFQRKDGTKM